ncbi:MAG: nicotinic acid mononucleotide adenylyltransferase [Flavobacteriales bacterium]|nr:nicotinic acid mononucleotide adenylyltransferase [Flavobacteriales bacterium]
MSRKKEIGLFFGSFNPIHIGHLILANYIIEHTSMNELWFIVSPQNPFKKNQSLLPEIHRFAMVNRSIEDDFRFRASNIEFSLPKPSYTSDTLAHLTEKYPDYKFSLIMGEDNLTNLHKWKNADFLVTNYDVYVYPRPNAKPGKYHTAPRIHILNAPLIEISASFIRNAIKEKKDVSWFLPPNGWKYIDEMGFYKK